jgi:hypothetical protein
VLGIVDGGGLFGYLIISMKPCVDRLEGRGGEFVMWP